MSRPLAGTTRRRQRAVLCQWIWDWRLGERNRAAAGSPCVVAGDAQVSRCWRCGGRRQIVVIAMPLAPALAARHRRLGQNDGGDGAALGQFLPRRASRQALPALVAATFVFGALNGLMDVAMNAHGTVVERAWGGAIMSSFHAAWSCGGILGAGFGAAALHADLGAAGLLCSALARRRRSRRCIGRELLARAWRAGRARRRCLSSARSKTHRPRAGRFVRHAHGRSDDRLERAVSDAGRACFGGFRCWRLRRLCRRDVRWTPRRRRGGARGGPAASGRAWGGSGGGGRRAGGDLANPQRCPRRLRADGSSVLRTLFPPSSARAPRAPPRPPPASRWRRRSATPGFMLGPVLIGAAAGIFSLRVGFALLVAALAAIVALERGTHDAA